MDREILKLCTFLLDLRPVTGFSPVPPPRPASPASPSGSVRPTQSRLTVVPCTGPLHALGLLQPLPLSEAWLRCRSPEQPLSRCPARPLALLRSSAQRQCGPECACRNVQFLPRTLGHGSTEAALRAALPALSGCPPAERCSVNERNYVLASSAVLSQGLPAGARGLSWATSGSDLSLSSSTNKSN